MLIVAGRVELDPAHVEAASAAAAEMEAASRAEPGCREYRLTFDRNEPGTVRVFEIWDDEAALLAHFESPHMAEYREKTAGLGPMTRDITSYEISSSTPLG